eukprot:4168501-Prymnesium_polylepis.1
MPPWACCITKLRLSPCLDAQRGGQLAKEQPCGGPRRAVGHVVERKQRRGGGAMARRCGSQLASRCDGSCSNPREPRAAPMQCLGP